MAKSSVEEEVTREGEAREGGGDVLGRGSVGGGEATCAGGGMTRGVEEGEGELEEEAGVPSSVFG